MIKGLTTKKSALENFFNLPDVVDDESKELQEAKHAEESSYDTKDVENENLFDEVYNKALSTYEKILDDIEDIDPKYGARNYEVAANFLSTALHAADKRAKLKEHKDKLNKVTKKGNVTTNNTVNINTTDLIKQLRAETVIDAEVVEVTPKQDIINE